MATQTHGNPTSGPLISDFAADADMAELVEFFIGELQDRIGALTTAWQSNDRAALRSLAHQLKGAAGGYGFPSITAAAGELETSLKSESAAMPTLESQLQALLSLCRRATQAQ